MDQPSHIFGNNFFQASGKGRIRIKKTILLAANRISPCDLSDDDRQGYLDVVNGQFSVSWQPGAPPAAVAGNTPGCSDGVAGRRSERGFAP